MFWFVGLIPDLASMRDATQNKALKFVYGAARDGLAQFGPPLEPI